MQSSFSSLLPFLKHSKIVVVVRNCSHEFVPNFAPHCSFVVTIWGVRVEKTCCWVTPLTTVVANAFLVLIILVVVWKLHPFKLLLLLSLFCCSSAIINANLVFVERVRSPWIYPCDNSVLAIFNRGATELQRYMAEWQSTAIGQLRGVTERKVPTLYNMFVCILVDPLAALLTQSKWQQQS